jgi:hypothetical protein
MARRRLGCRRPLGPIAFYLLIVFQASLPSPIVLVVVLVLVLGFFGVHPNPDPLFFVHGLRWTQSVFNLQRSKNDHENEDDDEDDFAAKHHCPPELLPSSSTLSNSDPFFPRCP